MASISFAREMGASVVTVDPFFHHDPHTRGVTSATQRRFNWNVRFSGAGEKIRHFKLTSDEFFSQNEEYFDFVYVDGSHDLAVLSRDLRNALAVCAGDSVIWIDDFGSSAFEEGHQIRDIVDGFIALNSKTLEEIHRCYQLGLKVTK